MPIKGTRIISISEEEINYINSMMIKLIICLKEYKKEFEEMEYLYHSPNRAKFDRLRIELQKELMRIRNKMYN